MSLREEIAKILNIEFIDTMERVLVKEEDGVFITPTVKIADKILALIDSQRCEWTPDEPDEEEQYIWNTGCGDEARFEDSYREPPFPYCHNCGKKILIKE